MEKDQITDISNGQFNKLLESKDWDRIIQLSSQRMFMENLILFFQDKDRAQSAVVSMTDEQITKMIGLQQQNLNLAIYNAMSRVCDKEPRISQLCLRLLRDPTSNASTNGLSSLPNEDLKKIFKARIPFSELHYNSSIEKCLKALSGKYGYENLKENERYALISVNISRRSSIVALIEVIREAFEYIQDLKKTSSLVDAIISPLGRLLTCPESNAIWQNDAELRSMLKDTFKILSTKKVFLSNIVNAVFGNNGNRALRFSSFNFALLTDTDVIEQTFYYDVFKRAVEEGEEDFMDEVAKGFLYRNSSLRYIRSLHDGVFDKLFNLAIEKSITEFIEHKSSDNFSFVVNNFNGKEINSVTFDEGKKFINDVVKGIIAKKESLNTDPTVFPQICLNIVIMLCSSDGKNVEEIIHNWSSYSLLDLLDDNERDIIIIGAIRSPTNETEFSAFIKANHPTYLTGLLSRLSSVSKICNVLPEKKRGKLDRNSFMKGKLAKSKETCMMSIVEIFLQRMNFWDNNDVEYLTAGYLAYTIFACAILNESVRKNDIEMKKAAISVFKRLFRLLTSIKHAKLASFRFKYASLCIADPLLILVGTEVEEDFVSNIYNSYIKKLPTKYLFQLINNLLFKSHIDGYNIDAACAKLIELALPALLTTPITASALEPDESLSIPVLTKENRFDNLKENMRFNTIDVLDVCNPLKTPNPISMQYNAPKYTKVEFQETKASISGEAWLKFVEFVVAYINKYDPKSFKDKATKMMISIQESLKNVAEKYLFKKDIVLDEPDVTADLNQYSRRIGKTANVLYAPGFFELLKEIKPMNIYTDSAYETVERLYTFKFMDESEAAYNKKKIHFYGVDFKVTFKEHPEFKNVNAVAEYNKDVNEYKRNLISMCKNDNNNLALKVNEFNLSQKIGKELDHRYNTEKMYYAINVGYFPDRYDYIDSCFVKFFSALDKCDANKIYSCAKQMNAINNCIDINCNTFAPHLATDLCQLLLSDFTKKKVSRKFTDEELTFESIYGYINTIATLAGPHLGTLSSLEATNKLSEKQLGERISEYKNGLLQALFKSRNINQIMICLSSQMFAPLMKITRSVISSEGISLIKDILPNVIAEVLKGKGITDKAYTVFASLALRPEFIGYPAPEDNFKFLELAATSSVNSARSVVANLTYYIQMAASLGDKIPDIYHIYEVAFKYAPDEMCAFFCQLINFTVASQTMRRIPALSDLNNIDVRPDSFLCNISVPSTHIDITKDIGELYEKVVDNFVLSGLVSAKAHITDLTISILSETKLSSNLPSRIAPFIEKGLKNISPGNDNNTFLKFATSFIAKNSQFEECLTAYLNALQILKDYSKTICRENARRTKNMSVPEAYLKFQETYNVIISTIEKPFSNFNVKEDIISMSHFCSLISGVLPNYRPFVSLKKFKELEVDASILADTTVGKCVNAETREESITELINILGNHCEIAQHIPNAIKSLFNELRSSFTSQHVKQFAEIAPKLQNAYNLTDIVGKLILEHLPECSDDELVEIMDKLGIFGEISFDKPVQEEMIQEEAFACNEKMCCFACNDFAPVSRCQKRCAMPPRLEPKNMKIMEEDCVCDYYKARPMMAPVNSYCRPQSAPREVISESDDEIDETCNLEEDEEDEQYSEDEDDEQYSDDEDESASDDEGDFMDTWN